jgi:hypothetical protein
MRNIFKTALIVGTLSTSLIVMADTPKKAPAGGSGSATAGSGSAKSGSAKDAGSGAAKAGSGSAATTPKKK